MSISNIPLSVFREFLKYKGLNHIKTEGGHEKWSSQKLLRPVILQTHIDPVPEFIIRNNLRTIDSNRKELEQWLKNR
ncbi:MAG: hypothetical protein ACHQD8_04535 [Chitinophagales bacterium]